MATRTRTIATGAGTGPAIIRPYCSPPPIQPKNETTPQIWKAVDVQGSEGVTRNNTTTCFVGTPKASSVRTLDAFGVRARTCFLIISCYLLSSRTPTAFRICGVFSSLGWIRGAVVGPDYHYAEVDEDDGHKFDDGGDYRDYGDDECLLCILDGDLSRRKRRVFVFRIDTELAVASVDFFFAPMLGSSEPRGQSGAVKEKKTHGVLT